MDEIRIENLEVYAYHGVYEEEKKNGQLFYVNAVLYEDVSAAGRTDRLELSTNYGEVCLFMSKWMKENRRQLLEAVACELAQETLNTFPLLQGIDLEIRKPQAPIPLPFESVSVKIYRCWHQVYLSIGSNMGDRWAYLDGALRQLMEDRKIRMVKRSSLYETKPYGEVKQDDFLNAAISLQTTYAPEELLEALQEIEKKADRKREIHWGPRTLDLDILLYDNMVYESNTLIIPHVDMENRSFVLVPLTELCPNKRHPILNRTIQSLRDALYEEKDNVVKSELQDR